LARPDAPVRLGDWTLAVGAGEGASLRDVAVARTDADGALAVAAATAELRVAPLGATAATLDADFTHGRVLLRDRQRVTVDASFARMALSTDARELTQPSRARLLPLAYYRADELANYRAQAFACLRAGLPVSPAQLARGDAVGLVHGLRAAAAVQPLVALAVVVWLLAQPRPRRRAVLAAAVAAIAVGLLVRIGLEARAGKAGDVQAPWLALLPPALTLALAAPFARWRGGGA
jgi:hypothetical protein